MCAWLFGSGDRDRCEDLEKKNKSLRGELQSIREYHDDYVHDLRRDHELELRDLKETHTDEINANERTNAQFRDELDADYQERNQIRDEELEMFQEDLKKKVKREIESMEDTNLSLESLNRELQLRLDEKEKDADLRVREGIVSFVEGHAMQVGDLQAKIARLEGEVKAALATSKASEATVKAVVDLLEVYQEDFETIVEKLPKVDLTKLSVNVAMPSPEVVVVQKSDTQQKK